MKRMLVENVQDAIGSMVGLIKTYRSKRRITQVVVSALFKRRMEEADVVIDQTFSDLMVRVFHDVSSSSVDDGRLCFETTICGIYLGPYALYQ